MAGISVLIEFLTKGLENLSTASDGLRSTGAAAEALGFAIAPLEGEMAALANSWEATAAGAPEAAAGIDMVGEASASADTSIVMMIEALTALTAKLLETSGTANETGSSLKSFGTAARTAGTDLSIGLSLPIYEVGKSAFEASVQMDGFQRGLTALTGSADAANKELKELRTLSDLPGLGFQEAAKGAILLQGAGMSAEQAEKSLKAFGNALATVGRGKQDLDGVTLALMEMESMGRVSERQIRMLMLHVPQIQQMMKQAFGTSDTQQLARMGIDSQTFITKVTEELGKLPQITDTVRNDIEDFQNTWFDAMNSLGEAMIPVARVILQTLVPAIEGIAKAFSSLPSGVQEAVVVLMGIAAVVGPVVLVLGQMALAMSAIVEIAPKLKLLMIPFGAIKTAALEALPAIVEFGASLWTALAPALPVLLAITAALAVIGGGIYLAHRDIEEKSKPSAEWQAQHGGAGSGPQVSREKNGPREYVVRVTSDNPAMHQVIDDRLEQFARGMGGIGSAG